FATLSAKPDPAQAQRLEADAADFRRQLASANVDESIGEIFLERAESAVAGFNADKSDASKLRPAQAVLGTVLPADLAAIEKPLTAPAPANHVINVTLVRWPYTSNLSAPASMLTHAMPSQYPG